MVKELAAGRHASATAAIPLLALCFFWTPLQAQTLRQLDQIVFEPVPLDALEDGATSIALYPEQPGRASLVHTPALSGRSLADSSWLSPDSASAFAPSVNMDSGSAFALASAMLRSGAGGDDDLAAATETWRQHVADLERDQGPYGVELASPLVEIGRLLQAQERHEEALEVLERSEHVLRVNHGLFSLEQEPALQLSIQSLLALGRLPEADERRHYLHYLHEQTYPSGDPRLVDSLLSLAEWNMNAFQRGIRFEAESIFIRSEFGGASSEKGVRQMAFGKLHQARGAYLQALRTLVNSGQFQDPRLPELEERLIESYFLELHRESLLKDAANYLNYPRATGSLMRRRYDPARSPVYRFGRDGYLRSLAYQEATPNTPLQDLADGRLKLGDWNLMFGRQELAVENYLRARDLLAQAGLGSEELEQVLNPALPLTLPVFTPTPHSREIQGIPSSRDLLYQGYVDVSFLLSDKGRADKPRILGASAGTEPSVQRRVLRLLRSSQFRPRIGREEAEEEIRLRYYYSY